VRFSWAAASHPGLRRSANEDSFRTRPDLGLFVVADGMGGHVAGEVASQIAVEAVEAFVEETAAADRHRTWPVAYDPALSLDANRLRAGFQLANRRIAQQARQEAGLRGMATTASAILVTTRGDATVAHVGDSRVYLYRAGTLRRVTTDHSWVEEQVRAGVLDRDAAHQHPWRNVVTRALAGGDDPDVDLSGVPLEPGDWVLLCSDGLCTVVPDGRIAEAVAAADAPDGLCSRLVGLANEAGGPDNITVVALRIDAGQP